MTKKSVLPWGCEGNLQPCNLTMSSITGAGEEMIKPTLLLHSCCGPCSTSVIERLAPDYNLTIFFYNPCITDAAEYEKRKEAQIYYIHGINLKRGNKNEIAFIEGEYEPEAYEKSVDGFQDEPEGGRRCQICFSMRLEKTAKYGESIGQRFFSTTLTVSPHKNYEQIAEIGRKLAQKYDIQFLDLDFKKKAGFQRSIQLAKENGLYRQNYCGCQYSMRGTTDME